MAHFPKVGDGFPQKLVAGLFSPKLVADFPKVDGLFAQSRWLISSKSVTEFHKIGGRISQLLAGLHETRMCGLICSMLVVFLLRAGF